MPVLRRRSAFLSHVRYRFVDCRWSLDDPEPGGAPTSRATFPAPRSSTSSAISPSAPGAGGRHPLPGRAEFAAAAGRAGIGDRHVRGRLRLARRRRAALVAAAPFRPRRLRRARPGGVARAAAHRRGDRPLRPSSSAVERTDDTIDRDELAARLGELVVVDARVPRPLARRAEPGRPRAGPHPRRASTRPWNERCPGAAGRRARRLLRLRRHRVRPAAPAPPRRPRRAGSTRARGRSGSSTRSCRSSALPRRPSRSRTGRGTAPSAAGSSASRAG